MSSQIESDTTKHRLKTLSADPNWSEYTIPERAIGVTGVLMVIVLSILFYPEELIQFASELDQGYISALQSIVPEIGLILLLVSIHECIHYVVAVAEGKKPQFGLRVRKTIGLPIEIDPYVIALEQRISRNENILVLIAPLVLINSLAMGVLFLPMPNKVNYYAQLVFVVNTVGSIQDLYNVIRLLGFPETTEFVNIVDDEVRTFYTTQSK
jgi:hypothetical protein